MAWTLRILSDVPRVTVIPEGLKEVPLSVILKLDSVSAKIMSRDRLAISARTVTST